VPPHIHSNRNGSALESRYSKDQLIDLFKLQKESDDLADSLDSLYVNSWEPNISNGTSSATWGRRDEHNKEGQVGADICWDRGGSVDPLNLRNLTEEEREVCRLRQISSLETSG
jgi:PERQ amino acid-rich with GYF domain-containing protein